MKEHYWFNQQQLNFNTFDTRDFTKIGSDQTFVALGGQCMAPNLFGFNAEGVGWILAVQGTVDG